MPKVVDRDAARRQIATALLSVLAAEGIAAVSVRTVAVEAGRSPGAVQKYFANKDEMLAAALELYCERSGERIDAVPRDQDPIDAVTALVAATLPLDAERTADTLILHELALRAARDESLARRLRELDRQVLDALTGYLGTGPETPSAIVAMADGLAMRLLYGSQTPSEAMAALRDGVAAVLAGRPAG